MCSDVSVRVEGLSKCYHMYEKPHHRLLQMLYRGRRNFAREFWALRDISFDLVRGETVGIVGRNGSGKSTLLQLICGTLHPTSGSVVTHGRVAALLELGSGFNPDFTGKENVYMNAALLGLTTEEIDRCYEDIISFADIGEFVDQPVKTYSSGMVVRLAFAVQAQIVPDIMIVDEALAVGDARFQAKCFARLKQLKERGTSILLVTHSSEQVVTHCTRALLLDAGRMIEVGEPRRIVNRYLDLLFDRPAGVERPQPSTPPEPSPVKSPAAILSRSADTFSTRPGYNTHEYRWGDGRARILDYSLAANGVQFPPSITSGSTISLDLSIQFDADVVSPILGITVKTKEGITVYGTNTEMLAIRSFGDLGRSGTVIQVTASFVCDLAAGDYFISVGVASRDGHDVVPLDRRYDAIHLNVIATGKFLGLVDLNLQVTALEEAA